MTAPIIVIAVVMLLVLVVASSTVRIAKGYERGIVSRLGRLRHAIGRWLWERLRGWLPTPQDPSPDARPLPTPWRRAPDHRREETPSNRLRGAPWPPALAAPHPPDAHAVRRWTCGGDR